MPNADALDDLSKRASDPESEIVEANKMWRMEGQRNMGSHETWQARLPERDLANGVQMSVSGCESRVACEE